MTVPFQNKKKYIEKINKVCFKFQENFALLKILSKIFQSAYKVFEKRIRATDPLVLVLLKATMKMKKKIKVNP